MSINGLAAYSNQARNNKIELVGQHANRIHGHTLRYDSARERSSKLTAGSLMAVNGVSGREQSIHTRVEKLRLIFRREFAKEISKA